MSDWSVRRTAVRQQAARETHALQQSVETPPELWGNHVVDLPKQAPRGRWFTDRLRTIAVAIDALACVGALSVADGMPPHPLPVLLAASLAVVLLAQGGFYRPRLHLSALRDLPGIIGRCFACGALTALLFTPQKQLPTHALWAGAAAAIGVGVTRVVGTYILRWLRTTRRIAHRTLILGGGQVAADLGAGLLMHPEHGLLPVGLLDSGPHVQPTDGDLTRLGEISDLSDAILDHDIQTVIVAFSSGREVEKVEVIRACDRMALDIFVVPRLFELHTVGRDMDTVWGIPLARLARAPFRSPSWKLKRLMDVAMSGVAILVLLPVLLLCALAARRETGGFFFRQTRVGLDGRHFEMLKFMSMKPVDDADAHRNWSIGSDARVGPVGRFLRRYSMDELPQLFNVLRGDMTLVGPRPERTYFVELLSGEYPRYMARHRVPAGLTGWAQVNGLRGDTSIEDRVRFDNYYIENWSLWLDVQILVRTLFHVFGAAGR